MIQIAPENKLQPALAQPLEGRRLHGHIEQEARSIPISLLFLGVSFAGMGQVCLLLKLELSNQCFDIGLPASQ